MCARPTKPTTVEGSQSTIAKGGAISISSRELHRAYDHPGVHEIGVGTQRGDGAPGPGVTGILDSRSHINAHPQSRPPPADSSWEPCHRTTATDKQGELIAPGDIVEQTRVIFRKIERLLKAAGGGMEHIVQTTDYITTTENYRRTADVRREFFKRPYPTATGVIVHGRLRPGAVIEISAVAVLPG